MYFVRKLLVVAALTVAAMALGASSASAVEVTSGGSHCTNPTLTVHTVANGCRVEVRSERETLFQVFVSPVWMTISSCEDHFEAAIGENGHGYLYNATTTGHGTGPLCTRTQCDEANMTKKPWELQLTSASSMQIAFCLRTIPSGEGAPGTPCYANIAVTAKNSTGQHEFFADGLTTGGCANPFIRVVGHWNVIPTASHPAIAIN